jgi:NAD(P)-dependent dehydrogenase (short-subunit alcohol dehydrogenase family)
MAEFDNKTVFITGAAQGQGRMVALYFARAGANIIGFDLDQPLSYPAYSAADASQLTRLRDEIEALGARAYVVGGDIRQAGDVERAVDGGVAAFGTIDVLFNNAGICAYGAAHELPEAEWDAMLDINLKGAWLAAKYVIPHMMAQRSGVIINNSSTAGLRGMNRLSHYAASKWGLVGLTKSWALELAPYGIRVLSIHPTGVNTPMNDGLAALEGLTPEQVAVRSAGHLLPVPWIEPEDVAEAVLFLASQRSRYATGSQYVLDAGLLTR